MNLITIIKNAATEDKYNSYPPEVRGKLLHLRKLIIETARDTEGIHQIEETLKWGEPSYSVKKGSPIRIDWKSKAPNQYAMYFNCSTSLVETFKVVFGSRFRYEKNRAILFDLKDEIPEDALRECIELALKYHRIKDLPLLGK